MDNDIRSKEKAVISDKLRNLAGKIDLLEFSLVPAGMNKYNKLVAEAVYTGERIIKEMRNFAALSMMPVTNIHRYDLIVSAEQLGISVADFENGLVEITIPCLLPHRKKGDSGFIIVPLIRALDEYVSSKPVFTKFEDCDICITHIYDKNKTHISHIRDHDNFELKKVMDVIGSFLLTSDSGRYCNTHIYTELSDVNMARIEIMQRDMFPAWVRRYKKYRKNVSH